LAAMPAEPWDGVTWGTWTAALKDSTGRKGKALFLPLRLALTGEDHGPDIGTILPLIGRDRAALRLKIAAGG
ncbi:MAG: glutamate--tRNA ligase, partial [Alphaproteobacteria bacterium]